ncbi:cell envelope integrity protein CreD [Fluviicola sp.]|jgi:inner membrane protein|uniref:cell envelope integrity protein CreD n=1 Tax=Fluviicola sp. TaxID=1917219 RepID=UPI002819E448|nr:cell envelope integrity protein CreD [Fluviicola sp.]MDR0803409.1 cell envelope integrity protein CreD [Fluviicola sp.]
MENQQATPNNKETGNWVKFLNSSFGRFLLIGFITLLLLAPLARVIWLIKERKERAEEIKNEIRSEWGDDFNYSGIVIRVPVKTGKPQTGYLFFFPETETNNLNVVVNAKKRGIYHFPVFQCHITSKSVFTPLFSNPGIDLKHAQIGLLAQPGTHLSDIRKILIDGKPMDIEEETFSTPKQTKLFYATAPFAIDQSTTQIQVNFHYSVNGSGKIILKGHAKKNRFNMHSNWKKPSFSGNSLPDPDSFKVKNGFSCSWNMLNITQNAKKGSFTHDGTRNRASINFLENVDHYQLNERTVKYAILVILLTFTVFYLIELIGNMLIHPVHYFMIGLSLILFYVILLSFSEQFGFIVSYLVASLGILTLLSWYSWSVLRSLKFTLTVFIAISLLYCFLYVLVNLETYALIVGCIGLFIVLTAIMSFTRRLRL